MNNIIDKIRKLRSLATSSNVNEAASAARAADKLAQEHRISEEEIAYADPSLAEKPVEDTGVLYETARITRWVSDLSVFLAEHYGCVMWNDCRWGESESGRKITRYRLVGRKSDIELTHYMFAFCHSEITRLSALNAHGNGRVYVSSYCEGAVAGIREQLRLQKEETKKTAEMNGQSMALVRLDERAKEAKVVLHDLHKNLGKSKATKTHRQFDGNAYDSGKQAGKSIHLGRG
jgi:hypothetical protein